MSAMTRSFAGPGHLATEAMRRYYERRALGGVGLILTEGTVVDPSGDGYNDVPHLATEAQAESWAPVVKSVHAAGGKIAAQLWHGGRNAHSDYTGGVAPVSSTSRALEGLNRNNDKPYEAPRALGTDEMPAIYAQHARAARRALAVGFDAVEVHMGHGYLVDQFFDARVNDRTDRYGGSVENRCRFGLELVQALLAEVGPSRLIARISPALEKKGPYDWPELQLMLAHLIPALDAAGLRMLDVSNARADYHAASGRVIRLVRPRWPHLLLGGASLSLEEAEAEVAAGRLDLVTWGRQLMADPEMVAKLRAGEPVTPFAFEMLKSLN
jgi:N-ethylmaleimide reductase